MCASRLSIRREGPERTDEKKTSTGRDSLDDRSMISLFPGFPSPNVGNASTVTWMVDGKI
jgi:hypothetical protein